MVEILIENFKSVENRRLVELEGYEIGKILASGGCGTVMLCTKHDEPNVSRVLKYINLNELTPHFSGVHVCFYH